MIIIVGGGIAGLSLAWELHRIGAQVTLVEASSIACGASGVATAYLEPRLGQTAMRSLERESLKSWPQWAAEIEEESGHEIGFSQQGGLRIARETDLNRFHKDVDQRAAENQPFQLLSGDEVRLLEPSLSSDIVAGCFSPEHAWVDGISVCDALVKILHRDGVQIIEQFQVIDIVEEKGAISVKSDQGLLISGDHVVFANGMGVNDIANLPADIPRCRAVRGCRLLLDMVEMDQPIRHLIKHHRGHLCPRGKTGLVVGTTYEPDEIDLTVDGETIEKLYTHAEDVFPRIRDLPQTDVRAGLRAKVGDGKLRLGRSRQKPRLCYSLSHAGAGFLRAPIIAREFSRYLLDGRVSPAIEEFVEA